MASTGNKWTLCPTHWKNAGDYEIGHDSIRYVILYTAKGHKFNKQRYKLVNFFLLLNAK